MRGLVCNAMRPSSRSFVLTLAFGMTFGFCLSYIFHTITVTGPGRRSVISSFLFPHQPRFPGDRRDAHNEDEMEHAVGPSVEVGNHEETEDSHIGENTLAREMYQKVRVLCWIMTGPSNHETKAKHVKKTWGKRCNVLLFMSSKADPSLPAVALPVGEGRENLWAKTKEAFRYIWDKHKDEADWFMKADDDTYVIVENLRYMLSAYNTSDPLWFGHKFRPYVKQGYFSGGAGYVLSKEALKRFAENGIDSPEMCRQDAGGAEDTEMGHCMEHLNVIAMDTRDSYGRGRFFPFTPEHHLIPGHVSKDFWYWEYIYYPSKEGLECCSDTAISFHYVNPDEMYVLEYLIYHLRPFGISNNLRGTPPPPPDKDHKAAPWTGWKNEPAQVEEVEKDKKKEGSEKKKDPEANEEIKENKKD